METEPRHHQDPAEDPSVTYTRLYIETRPEQIPTDHACMLCEQSTKPISMPYELPYTSRGKGLVARCEEVLGYRCDACDVETYFLPATIEVLKAALEVVCTAGDTVTAERVRASLDAGQQHLVMAAVA